MKPSARILALLKMALWIILVISLTACASATDDEPASISPPEDGQNTEYHLPRLLGYVLDPDGGAVAFAEVGGEEIATEDGVASGDFLDYEGGWIPVTAMGYASGYAYAFAEDQGFPFFVTHLTLYQSLDLWEGEPLSLQGSSPGGVYLSADLPPGIFQDPSVVVGLAVIEPYDISPIMAPYPDGEGLKLKTAFALEAFDQDWLPIDLNSGAVIPLTLEMPTPLSERAKFARFDRAAGEWQSLDLNCEIAEGNLYTCQLDKIDPLIGIFDQPENVSIGVIHSPREGSASLREDNTAWDDLDEAIGALQDWINAQEWGVDPSNPTLIELVEKLAKVAQDYAKKNRNESGKSILAEAAPHAMATGQLDLANELTDEMASIAEEVGKEALKENNCAEYKKMIKAAEQIQYLKADFSLADQIMKKVADMVKDCDVWTGTITVALKIPSTHPAGLDAKGGGGLWWEFHSVKIRTNVKTHAMYGEGKVRIAFPQVTFERSDPCPKVIEISGSGGDAMVVFKGIYDGYSFYIHELGPQGSGGSIHQSWQTEAKQDGECKLVRENSFSFPNFYSLIVHGVSSDSPPISYYEILDTGTAAEDSMGLETFDGKEFIVNSDPDMGVYPFLEGQVYWHFWHMVKVLPLKNEK